MRETMGWQGEGRRFTGLLFRRVPFSRVTGKPEKVGRGMALGVALMALLGCAESVTGESTSTSAANTSAARAPTSTAAPVNGASAPSPAAPERIVQRLSPAAETRADAERLDNATTAAASASAATARGSDPAVSDTTITPRHLEAELNRLEAELAN